MQIKNKQKVVLDGRKLRVGIVTARFNQDITKKLTAAALRRLAECRVAAKNITLVSVAGSMEIPYALQKLARSKRYDCLVALGCVVRGETAHFDYVCKTAQEGVLRVSLDYAIPIGFGVITVNSLAQAEARGHLGADAVSAAVELALL
ncbi:MAG: 6,7-dimethyl-8-ribityllumazine synthase [Candidatus Magasanikbacteria bacterium]|nr:6,7-dimethyl-8-ribityllumazine synthase [Candidatus Magasanikbacteria bacterium]